MSSMRNAVQRRVHRERGQPEERAKWGLLEKHKDYSARARDFNAKKTKLKALRQKVLDKNPDEFYFGMVSQKGPTTAGKNSTGTLNGDKGNKVLDQDAVRLFKTQDLGYVRTMRNKTQKEVESLRRRVVGIEAEGRRVVFVEGEGERELKMDAEEEREEREEEKGEEEAQKRLRRAREKEAEKLENMLEIAEKRLEALTEAEEALDLQRKKMGKSMSVGGVTKAGVKFKVRERKK
ncbi:hypothetical protein V495_05941 [Pseudogymnoascus sp. VKM F-4514 (FW-929)]|nr:hypothetical protein V495_05941 [Pseudogymnoascus sp. VKM F-4514 (FW-929)]KFY61434.1 hypothetical protein V497_02953 [Pseudogymnoascus sp. VKM F-4516 (FW-969)]